MQNTKELTKEEIIALAQEAGLTKDDLKVKSKFDELKDLRSAHREVEDQIKAEAIKTLRYATDEEVDEICRAIEAGESDAKELVNADGGYRLNEMHECRIEIAESNREETINEPKFKADLGNRVGKAHRILKATFTRGSKTGQYAGRARVRINAVL